MSACSTRVEFDLASPPEVEELVRRESRAGRSNEVLVHQDTRESRSNEELVRR